MRRYTSQDPELEDELRHGSLDYVRDDWSYLVTRSEDEDGGERPQESCSVDLLEVQ